MSFEKIVSNRPVYLPYILPGEEELRWIDLQPNVVTRVDTAVLAAIGARKNSPLDAYFERGILRKVRRSNAENEVELEPAQVIAQKLAAGEEVDGSFGGMDSEENIEGMPIPTASEREVKRPTPKPLPTALRGPKR